MAVADTGNFPCGDLLRSHVQSLAKLTVPKLAGAYSRQRLFELLDSQRDAAGIWISGLPGAGKTTLIASYLAARQVKPLWYRLDEGDADSATLFYYLGLAAKQAAPRKKKPLPLFTPEYRSGLPAFARRYFRELYARLPHPFVVVFDNYQDIGSETRVHEVMQYALEEVPESGNVIIMSRAEPPAQVARLRANGGLRTIDPGLMRLTHDEAKGIVQTRDSMQLSNQCLGMLVEKTHGWAAGLVLFLELGRAGMPEHELRDAPMQAVFDYFAAEILRRLDSETRDVLFITALLPMTTAPLAERLTGCTRAAQVLERLYRNNYFTLRDGQAEPVYQYHPLFREFLLKQAHRTYSPEHLTRLKCDAASLLAASGQVEAAIELLHEAQHWSHMGELIKCHAQDMLGQGRAQTLAEWINALPEDVGRTDPWLAYWLGTCLITTNPQQSLPLFEHAFSHFEAARDHAGVYLAWCGAVQAIYVDWGGSHRRWDAWVKRLEELRLACPECPSLTIGARVAQLMNLILDLRLPSHPQRAWWREQMLNTARASGDPTLHLMAIAQAVRLNTYNDLPEASAVIDELEGFMRRGDASPSAMISAQQALAVYYCAAGHLEESRNSAEAALALAERTGVHIWDFPCQFWVAVAALHTGDLEKAVATHRQMGASPVARASFGAQYHQQLASSLAVQRGEYAQALVHAQECVRSALQCGLPLLEVWATANLAWTLYLNDERNAAHALIEDALRVVQDSGVRWPSWGVMHLKSYFYFHEGEEARGLELLAKISRFRRSYGYVFGAGSWMGTRPPSTLPFMLAKALEAGIETDHTRKCIRLLGILPDERAQLIEHWPWPVKIHTLGRFVLLMDDQALTFGHKAPKRTIALLKCLIAYGGRDVSAQRLIDALWPEAEGDAAQKAFDIALHRLRKLLRYPDALHIQEGRLTLNDKLCWVDTWAFERLLANAETAASLNNEQESQRGIERGLTLYHGAFLADETDAPWGASVRERLRAKFILHIARLANNRADSGNLEEALKLYQRGLEADDLAEEFYQGVMRCYQSLGRYAEALAVYRRLRQTLSITLGIPPSPASQAMFRALQGA